MAIELEKLDMSKKVDRFKFTRRIMQDNHTHIDDCNCVIELCTLVDELQMCAESAEQSKTEAWVLVDELTVSLQQALEQGERRFNEVTQERDKFRAALDHAESHIQEMENAEGRAFFADTAAMAKKLGDTMQERDALAERVKALESQFCPTCKHHWSLHRDICHERIGTESGIWVYCDCAERENDHA